MEIHFKSVPFDLAFHPSSPLVAAGLVSGRIHLYRYADCAADDRPPPRRLWSCRPHKESCRGLAFVNAGEILLSVSPDRSIDATGVESGQRVSRFPDAHDTAINRIVNLTDTTIATGDDGGTIKIWDTRQSRCVGSIAAHEDFVSDLEFVGEMMELLSVSGDGTLAVSSLRRNKVDFRSEFSEDELLSVVLAKQRTKVVCGSQSGVLLLYSWGEFQDCDDRFVGHPSSVDSMLKLDEATLITGSSDGIIRQVSILPNRITGVIGEHSDFPVERLAFSFDKSVLGSVSHDQVLKLWDMTGNSASSNGGSGNASVRNEKEMDRRGKSHVPGGGSSSFFADLL
ncbi:hypothetical protein SELMODRAFT_76049 [Selaginella moellendorffii]|uniref:Uncharacterized protein n=1 Tax=Selaginella moellendorffii TaxID=88036 RepID=D8QRA9_SELML|nr:WD repeat-containing protein 55 [Selaginella moellendorffii]EFJ36749.1 hypothetical protein SELMODRAFT_76049 [Selaginella moellendorffii]|eukprot:XP_002961489.1 WD repeat-containing protein 55 [Selaginella moellendorffii]